MTAANVEKSLRDNESFDPNANLDNLKVTISGGDITIDFKPNSVFDEADSFNKESGTTLVAAKAIWGWYPAASTIVVNEHGDFTDTFGNTDDEVSAGTYYTAATASKLNLSGLQSLAEAEPWRMYYDSNGFYVHPAIWKNLSDSDKGDLLFSCYNFSGYC